MVEKHFFRRSAKLIPAIHPAAFIPDIFTDYPWWIGFMSNLINIFIIFTILLTIDALLNAFTDIYKDFEIAKTKPIKGYVQIIKILVYFLELSLSSPH
ncbi:MAG: hypothetical protein U5L09_20530 [Bacteroidales bacterium]|nr:hypothetical protein [Bacteroidales bacterium]